MGGVPREQKMLKGHLPRVINHRLYSNVRRLSLYTSLTHPCVVDFEMCQEGSTSPRPYIGLGKGSPTLGFSGNPCTSREQAQGHARTGQGFPETSASPQFLLLWAHMHRPAVQGYLANEKTFSPRTMQYAYVLGRIVVLGGWAFSYERGTPVGPYTWRWRGSAKRRFLSNECRN